MDVVLRGRSGGEAVYRETRSGQRMVKMRLAVRCRREGGQWESVWWSVQSVRSQVLGALEGLVSGQEVLVKGAARLEVWDGNNGRQETWTCWADEVEVSEPKDEAGRAGVAAASAVREARRRRLEEEIEAPF